MHRSGGVIAWIPGAPSSHFLAEVPLMQVAALANAFASVPGREPHASGPETFEAETSIAPFFALTRTLQSVNAPPRSRARGCC